jgi:hypothetical protein
MERNQTPPDDEVVQKLREALAAGNISGEEFEQYRIAYLSTLGKTAILGEQLQPKE